MDREQLAAQLAHLGIRVEGRLHAPAMTCEQASALVGDLPGLRVKNLFLKESRGQRLLLVVADEQTPVNLAALAERLGTRRLSFASPERLRRHLGVEPGAVTLLALVNDGAHQVELVLERRVWEAPPGAVPSAHQHRDLGAGAARSAHPARRMGAGADPAHSALS